MELGHFEYHKGHFCIFQPRIRSKVEVTGMSSRSFNQQGVGTKVMGCMPYFSLILASSISQHALGVMKC